MSYIVRMKKRVYMTLEERVRKLEATIQILMEDPTLQHKIAVAASMTGRNKNPITFEIKPNYQ
jgi:hypothetical protein